MINVENMNPVDEVFEPGKYTILDFIEIPTYDADIYDLDDDKSFKKYMYDVESSVRNSFEYRTFVQYLRNTEGMNKCSVLNIAAEPGSKVRIELHHYPLTLYDICMAAYRKRKDRGEDIGVYDIAEEVLYLHYIGWVGLIPLSQTVHETFHNGYMFIPTDKVRGNYRAFVESYYNYIDPETLDALDNAEQATKDNLYDKRKEIFNDHKMYVNIAGSYNLPNNDEMKRIIKDHVTDLKTKKVSNNGKVMCTVVQKTSK